jgi:DegV family protein with EDD domain
MSTLTLENTALVADSTCDPPPGYFDRAGMAIVPLRVHFGDETYRDYVDLSSEAFFAKLRESTVHPTTTQPTAADFETCYAELRRDYEHVFSFHLSRLMSGTYDAAVGVAAGLTNVHVYDTRFVSTAITLIIERVRARLEEGVELAELETYVDRLLANTRLVFQVATLEYLRRGGRIGRASAMVGDVLGIRPILQCRDGELEAYAKVRGERRALDTMAGYLEKHTTADDDIRLALFHAEAPDSLSPLRQRLVVVRPQTRFVLPDATVGAIVGTHSGPGVLAFAMVVE